MEIEGCPYTLIRGEILKSLMEKLKSLFQRIFREVVKACHGRRRVSRRGQPQCCQ